MVDEIDWESFQSPKTLQNPQQSQIEINQQPAVSPEFSIVQENIPVDWESYLSPETYQGSEKDADSEGILEMLKRNLFQHAARGTEQILGAPGNLESFGRIFSPINSALNALIGEPKGERTTVLPTSKEFREINKAITKGETEPKGKIESALSETTEDVTSLLAGGGRTGLIKNLGIPFTANVAKQIVKEAGFSEDKANLTKAAIWLPLMLADSVNGRRYAANLMNAGRQVTPENLQFDVPRLLNSLDNVLRHPHMLSVDSRTNLARQTINRLRDDINNGLITQRGLMTAYDGINAAKRDASLFALGRTDLNYARRAIDRVRIAVRNEIQATGAQTPQAIQYWRNGVSAFATLHRSNAITNTVERWVKGPYGKLLYGPAAALFGAGALSTYASRMSKVPGLAKIPAATAVYKSGQIAYRAWTNPILRRYYSAALQAAASENRQVFLSNFEKLNKALEKELNIKVGSKKKNPNTQ